MRQILGCVIALTLWLQAPVANATGTSRIINGQPVPSGEYREVVRIRSGNSGCTATVVGPRVIATAAHCASNGATATFSIDGKQYSAKITRSSLYPAKDHDISLGLATEDIEGIEYASIGGRATEGLGITLLGYGCTNPGGSGGNDGVLRYGESTIVGFSAYDMVSRKPGGAALCMGDSGGPAFVIENEKHLLLGINSKGNIQDTNYNTRTDTSESQSFLKSFVEQNNTTICGVNADCSAGPVAPTCTLKAVPPSLAVGQTLTLSLTTSGEVTKASIDGVSVSSQSGQSVVKPPTPGDFTSVGLVEGPGGQSQCTASYHVEKPAEEAPSCTLTAIPNEIQLGESLTLEMNATGNVTSATIEGEAVTWPLGKKVITPAAPGSFVARSEVKGPGGSNFCSTGYQVSNDPQPDPSLPNFSVVPTYCGDNVTSSSSVKAACLAILKKDSTIENLRFSKVILVHYRNGTKEVLPIMSSRQRVGPEPNTVKEDLIFYANASVAVKDYMVLDSRKGVLAKKVLNGVETPQALEGRTATGQYFVVETLKAHAVSY